MILDTPNSLKSRVGLQSYGYVQPSTYIPTITQKEYDIGYIDRYFLGKINYFEVIETSLRDYNVASSLYFIKLRIKWKITGPEFNIYSGVMLETTGVVNYNILQIRDAAQKIRNIELVLDNPKQFWRGF
jgi:hypothetical protein